MEHSDVTNTAMVLEALNAYLPQDRKSELDDRAAKAKTWALALKPACAEDAAARIWVLKAAGATSEEIESAARVLLAVQRPDGGWGPADQTRSDAYTTGVSLYALRSAAGLPATDEKLRRGVGFLLRTQDADGSWYEAKATPAFNNHFDTAFPHGYDQYASFAGTCWATIGLMEMMEGRTAAR